MTVNVNDAPTQLEDGATLSALLTQLSQDRRNGLAVAVNGRVVLARQWAEHELADGDRVLLIQAAQGG